MIALEVDVVVHKQRILLHTNRGFLSLYLKRRRTPDVDKRGNCALSDILVLQQANKKVNETGTHIKYK